MIYRKLIKSLNELREAYIAYGNWGMAFDIDEFIMELKNKNNLK